MTSERLKHRRGMTPWKRRRRRVFMVLAFIAVILAAPLWWRIRLRAEVLQEIAEVREAGMPVTLEALAAWEGHAPDEAEADAAFDAIFAAYHAVDPATFSTLPKLRGTEPRLLEVPYSPVTRTALEQRVQGNEPMLAKLNEASKYSRFRMIRDIAQNGWSNHRSLEIPLEVLLAHACLLAEDGQGDAALDEIILGITVARASRATPLLQTFNAAMNGESLIAGGIYPVLIRAKVSGEKLGAFWNRLRDDNWLADLTRSVAGSRCLMLQTLEGPRDPGDLFESLIGGHDIQTLWILRFSAEVPALTALPIAEWDGYLRARNSSFEQQGYPFWWFPSPSEAVDPLVLAVLRFRQAHGALPERLEALVPEYLDALPAEPRRFLQDDGSFTIYGLGENGQDDGGQPALDAPYFTLRFKEPA